jgi:hypothetical protein
MPRTHRDGRPHLYLVDDPPGPSEPAAPAPVDVDALLAGMPSDEGADLERDLSFIDQVLAIQPVPQDVLVWRAVSTGSFELPWRDLPGTLHQELSYLAVALARYPALGAAEAVLHLRVPAGVPGVYLNPFDHGDRLPAPTLLLGRGLAVFVHEVRRQDGQWYLRADLIPPPPHGWRERIRAAASVRGGDGGAGDDGRGASRDVGGTPRARARGTRAHGMRDVMRGGAVGEGAVRGGAVQEGGGHGR